MKHQIAHALLACLYCGPLLGVDKAAVSAGLALAYAWLVTQV